MDGSVGAVASAPPRKARQAASSAPRPRRRGALARLALAAALCGAPVLLHGSMTGSGRDIAAFALPFRAALWPSRSGGDVAAAMARAWAQLDGLSAQVERRGIVPNFGARADAIVRRAAAAGGDALAGAVDAPLRALFVRQLQALVARAVDAYDVAMERRPNPADAALAARAYFERGVAGLTRPGADWSSQAELSDLIARVDASYSRDLAIVAEQAKSQVGMAGLAQNMRQLQRQARAVKDQAESKGGLPWNVRWQYMVENTPWGFRGQYSEGRHVVETLLTPNGRKKDGFLNRLGPLNLAVAFDM